MDQVKFDVPPSALMHIKTILDRAKKIGFKFSRVSAHMDLCATHANGCPMDFDRLAAADDFNLAHDFAGIRRHIDRETGNLTDHFRPRFAAPSTQADAHG